MSKPVTSSNKQRPKSTSNIRPKPPRIRNKFDTDEMVKIQPIIDARNTPPLAKYTPIDKEHNDYALQP